MVNSNKNLIEIKKIINNKKKQLIWLLHETEKIYYKFIKKQPLYVLIPGTKNM